MVASKKWLLVLGIVLLLGVTVSAAAALATLVYVVRNATAGGGFPPPAGPPKVVRTLNADDQPVSGNAKWEGGELEVTAAAAGVQRLFEVPLTRVEQSMITYRFRIKTDDLRSSVYPELWCRVEGHGEFFSRGLDRKVAGTNNWLTVEIPFYLMKDQFADLVWLNLVFEGAGTVRLKDIEVLATPLKSQ